MLLKILGALIFAWGAADMAMGFAQKDLWGMIGVQLPDIIWRYSHYIAMAIGAGLFMYSGSSEDDANTNA